MKRLVLVPLLLAVCVAHADIPFRVDNANVGPISVINLVKDGGLTGQRDSGIVAMLECAIGGTTTRGCVEPGTAQSFTGQKTFGNGAQDTCVAHASLTACSSPNAGLHQCCSTHSNAQVWCNGTTNLETTGSTSYATLGVITNYGLLSSLSGYLWAAQLPYAYAVTGLSGFIASGTGAGSLSLRFTDGTNICDCAVDCDTDQSAYTCAGNCSYAANTLVIALPTSDTCTTPPTLRSPLTIAGTR